ncbi:FecR domain-containing protein [Desulfogranum japonicum]|uniref:FecR domain-containing protein n=1 Tax=Desulfogranum japonicum TaxID=231447 RepID=UPI0003FBD8FA|nr:FecR domain-containing protein [Desulfogranum japonicum]
MQVFHARMSRKKIIVFSFMLCMLLTASQTSHAVEQLIPIYVHAGTNLIHMARDYCYSKNSWKIIARINKLKPPYLIKKDTSLQIPLSLLIAEPLQAQITHKVGTVSIQHKQIQGNSLNAYHLKAGDALITGDDGYAHLLFPNNRSARVDANSRVTLNYLIRLTDGSVKIDYAVEKGAVTNTVTKRLKNNDSHRTRTPTAITGIRGTEYRLKTSETDSSIETLSGLVAVQAGNSSILLPDGQGTKISKGKRPDPPKPLPPPPAIGQYDAVQKTLPVRLPAPRSDESKFYTLRLSSDLEGARTLAKINAPPGSTFVIPDLADGHYNILLTGTDNEGFESIPSGPYPLQLRTIPVAPVISTPETHMTTWESQVTVQWLEDKTVAQYHCQLAKNSKFTDIIEEKNCTGTKYQSPVLDIGNYYFQVQAIADDGFRTFYSSPIHWTIAKKPEIEQATFESSSVITLNWPSMGDDCRYDIQIAEDSQFKQLLIEQKALSTHSYNISTPLLPGKYMIRVRGNFKGTSTPWTPPQQLTIEQPPPGWQEMLMGIVTIGIIVL